jgi:hypothetical protein
LSAGPPGEWDALLTDLITPVLALRKGETYYLYYTGATGTRDDGGPANRALGVATSADGIQFTKHPGNPILTHQPSAPGGTNVVEEGIFSAGGSLDEDGTVVLYFGGMEATGSTSVDSDGVLATSADGLTFTVHGDVIRHGAPGVIGNDEVFPLGALRTDDGAWHCYYTAKGGDVTDWTMVLASGPAANSLVDIRRVTGPAAGTFKGAGDPILLSDSRVLVPIKVRFGTGQSVELRSTSIDRLDDLSTLERSYRWGGVDHLTIFVDRAAGMWFLYYRVGNAIGVKTAPVTFE